MISRLSYCSLDRGGSRAYVASKMKCFVTIVSECEPLAVEKKTRSMFVPTGVLEPPLVEIEMKNM